MGIFSRSKKDGKSKKKGGNSDLDQQPAKPQWTDAWARSWVEPEEVHELVKRCTDEIKTRALDHPFLLLPFRPTSDPSAVRTFIRHFFDNHELRGEALVQELRMTEPMVITGVIKWCWSRLQGGVVGWDAYELFKVGEQDSNMARDSFKTFIPLSVENGARTSIIFSFFDLLSAIAAHGRANGFGGRKLSRMAAWWAFEHKDTSNGFDGGYKEWLKAADATSHLFFAYLRTLGPAQQGPGTISMLPRSLQSLLQDTEYPPKRPILMQASTFKVVMIVESVSPTPFALLRRGNHFQYRDDSLQRFSAYEDPVAALTEECHRVLRAIAAANQTQAVSSAKHSTSLRDASWSRFEDIGFQSTLDDDDDDMLSAPAPQPITGLRTTPASGVNRGGRPTTPSWADFLSSGFVDDRATSPTSLLPPDKVLPPIDTTVRQQSAQSHRPRLESGSVVEQGELASINRVDLDEAFWWVWMNSLAPEETAERKSAFGRCAVIETIIRNGRWLVFEEVVKGAATEPAEGAYVAQKKSFFSWRRKDKDKDSLSRRKSTAGKNVLENGRLKSSATTGAMSKSSLGPDQQAKIQAAAQQLQAKQERERRQAQGMPIRRGRTDAELVAEKTQSVMTLQPMIMKEASPAMKWANKYDKDTIREAYLANSMAGRGLGQSTMQSNGLLGSSVPEEQSPSPLPRSPSMRSPREEQHEEPLGSTPAASEMGHNSPLPPLPPQEEAQNTSFDMVRDNMASPEPAEEGSPKQHKKLHKEEKKGGGGFRRLFGRQRRASKVPENAPADIAAALAETDRGASTPAPESPIRSDTPQQETPGQRTPHQQQHVETAPVTPMSPQRQEEAHYAEPVYEPSAASADDSRVNTADAEEATDEFSRFDQGPLDDQPAFVPESDEEDDATPPPIQRHRSPNPQETRPQTAPAIERWAQIRKNAAERAAAAQHTAYGSLDCICTDTATGIESRVARIKARVAELTNNMDGTQAPGSRPPVPR
ncbi:hypothetical protein M406DRAFT_43569 [Cryphonectria parasitica EP155]|uniref:Meiotically up-regulated protein Msb1/Mug8 domain-containing protein n=1 Tax=Cryphonectria parasitica (strain ATCC 38755 / EP155) TaxID=660469 RepID=A0A9P5CNW0_CRYP1|nr:uncharacterized protein M406DRAFT_43569 [Cryphonectria parasitica EP155]KAF3764541.1 hypothetical protein M406DRAFT_43569 [Cryphonectria parasitica EP155]